MGNAIVYYVRIGLNASYFNSEKFQVEKWSSKYRKIIYLFLTMIIMLKKFLSVSVT